MDDFDRYLAARNTTDVEREHLAVRTQLLDLGFQLAVRRSQMGESASVLERRHNLIAGSIGKWERGCFGRDMFALVKLLVALGVRLTIVSENTEERVPAETFPPGEYVRKERRHRGWTVACLATRLGMTAAGVRRLERGETPMMPALADAFSQVFGTLPQFWLRLAQAHAQRRGGDTPPSLTISER